MSFSEDFTFTRGTGTTRINAAGLIVGVDFSSTSITFGTGSKAFTLAADLTVNRDWSIGESVIAVSQAAPLGNMEGTVTAYDPATQVLTINVVTSTGTGTSTNWRIGSLEVRRDADGVLREPLRSNAFTQSSDYTTAAWTKSEVTITPNSDIAPNGSNAFQTIIASVVNADHFVSQNLTIGTRYTLFGYAKPAGYNFVRVNQGATTVAHFDLVNKTLISTENPGAVFEFSPGVYFFWTTFTVSSAQIRVGPSSGGGRQFAGDGVSGVKFWGLDAQAGSGVTSHIPTTTVAVTRNADTFTFTPAAIAKFRQGQGALIVEANASDAGTAQRAALRLTGSSGEIRFGKQGVATSGNFTKMAEGGDVQLLGNATQGITNNGLEYAAFAPISTATGVTAGNLAISGATHNGISDFGVIANVEQIVNSTFTSMDGKGLGGSSLNGAHHNGSRFIIATGGPGVVGISTDGLSYRRVNTPVITQACNEVTSGMVGPTLRNVIVGAAGFIATSDDNGETWTARTSGTGTALNGVTRSTTHFVACGQSAVASNNMIRSTDGITWLSVANSGASAALLDVHANGATLVAVGGSGAITVSNDNGATWAASPSSGVVTTQNLNGVHYNASANLWVAVGNAGAIITATDPTGTWTLRDSTTGVILNEVFYFNNLFIAGGASNRIVTSPNGITWTLRVQDAGTSFAGFAASGTRLIATGSAGALFSSEDGLTYTSRTNNNATLNGIAYGAGVYVSVGNAVNGSGYIATIDGAGTVTRRVSGTVGNVLNVKYESGVFIAGGVGVMLTSTDGVTWSSAVTAGSHYYGAFDGTYHIAARFVGVTGRISYATSAFGPWIDTAVGGGQFFFDAAFANGVVVLVGNSGTIYTKIAGTLPTSANWTARTSNTTQALTSVMFSTRDQRWYAAGNAGTLLYSEDNGVTWLSVNNAGFGAVSNTTLQANKLLPQWKSGRNTMALSYKANEVIVGLNGVAVTDTANTIPSITAGVLGESFNGKIKSAKFQPNPLTAAEVVAITGVTK